MAPAMTQRGYFISIEGGEGVGKSVFSQRLMDSLTALPLPVIRTAEPGGTPSAQLIRQLFLHPPAEDPLVPEAELFLVSAARAQHVGQKIRPALKQGTWVICDRFADSSRVYQGAMGGLPAPLVESMIQVSCGDTVPDLTFLLDCDVAIMMERLTKRSRTSGDAAHQATTRFDEAGLSYHQQLQQAYQQVARQFPERIVVLDAALTPDAVLLQAMDKLRQRGLL